MCLRTVHEHLPNEIFYSCLFVKKITCSRTVNEHLPNEIFVRFLLYLFAKFRCQTKTNTNKHNERKQTQMGITEQNRAQTNTLNYEN